MVIVITIILYLYNIPYPIDLSEIEYLRIINISVYFTANGEPAMIEVYIQVLQQ